MSESLAHAPRVCSETFFRLEAIVLHSPMLFRSPNRDHLAEGPLQVNSSHPFLTSLGACYDV